jgi:hypothetical protein
MQVEILEKSPQLGWKTCMLSIMVTNDHLPLLRYRLIISISIIQIRVVIRVTSLFLIFSCSSSGSSSDS